MALHHDSSEIFSLARRVAILRPCGQIARHQANVVAALVALHRRLFGVTQAIHRTPERFGANAAATSRCRQRRGGGRGSAGAGTDQRDRRNAFAVDGDGVGEPITCAIEDDFGTMVGCTRCSMPLGFAPRRRAV